MNAVHTSPGQVTAASNGKKVLIRATDERTFEIDPRSADIPSLKDDEINDRSVTERAIGRKRGGFGKAFGDVVLPSGRTVSQLVGEAVSNAYREAGYEVVTDKSTSDAIAVNVHVIEFWSWFSPGFWSVAVNNKSQLRIESLGSPDLKVVARINERMQAVTESDWKKITEAGLQEITRETQKQLK
ncbi:flagellar biosynthesis protein [Pseudomonas sp. 3A(2025)]